MYLNTSYVEVKRSPLRRFVAINCNLNTSYVEVKHQYGALYERYAVI